MRDGARNGVSERLPSAHPVETSVHGTDRRDDVVTEGDEEGARICVVLRLRWWKEGFMDGVPHYTRFNSCSKFFRSHGLLDWTTKRNIIEQEEETSVLSSDNVLDVWFSIGYLSPE